MITRSNGLVLTLDLRVPVGGPLHRERADGEDLQRRHDPRHRSRQGNVHDQWEEPVPEHRRSGEDQPYCAVIAQGVGVGPTELPSDVLTVAYIAGQVEFDTATVPSLAVTLLASTRWRAEP